MNENEVDLKFVELEIVTLGAALAKLYTKKDSLINKIQAECEHVNTFEDITHVQGGYDHRGYDAVRVYCKNCSKFILAYETGDYGYA